MPRIAFKTENKIQSGGPEINRLKLAKGERARLIAGLEDPTMEYVHTLRKPKIENGKAVIETIERFGKMVEQIEKEFVSRTLCEGEAKTLDRDGSDPKNCPMCALAVSDPEAADAPERRYAMNVFKYKTKPNSFDVAVPFSGEILQWSFTPRTFNKIVDIAEEFGDLQSHDLNLGPCENAQWQKYDIAVAGKAAWRGSDEDKKFVKEAFKENRLEEIELATGQKKERRWIDRDLADVKNAWAVIRGNVAAPAENDADLDSDLNSLMDEADDGSAAQTRWASEEEAEETPKKSKAKSKKKESVSVDSLLDEVEDEEEKPAAPTSDDSDDSDDDDDDSFASLLHDLDDDDDDEE